MPHPNAYSPADEIRVGDVVYCEGSSAIIGDVIALDDDGAAIVTWRSTTTREALDDLILNRDR